MKIIHSVRRTKSVSGFHSYLPHSSYLSILILCHLLFWLVNKQLWFPLHFHCWHFHLSHRCIQQFCRSPSHSSARLRIQRCPDLWGRSSSPDFSSHWVHLSSSHTCNNCNRLCKQDHPLSSSWRRTIIKAIVLLLIQWNITFEAIK